MAYTMDFNIWVKPWFFRNRAATPLMTPAITEAPSETNAFEFLSSFFFFVNNTDLHI